MAPQKLYRACSQRHGASARKLMMRCTKTGRRETHSTTTSARMLGSTGSQRPSQTAAGPAAGSRDFCSTCSTCLRSSRLPRQSPTCTSAAAAAVVRVAQCGGQQPAGHPQSPGTGLLPLALAHVSGTTPLSSPLSSPSRFYSTTSPPRRPARLGSSPLVVHPPLHRRQRFASSAAMTARVLDGTAIAKSIRERIGAEIVEKQKLNPRYKPSLKIIQGTPASCSLQSSISQTLAAAPAFLFVIGHCKLVLTLHSTVGDRSDSCSSHFARFFS